jgi:hypothetical protein
MMFSDSSAEAVTAGYLGINDEAMILAVVWILAISRGQPQKDVAG